MKTRQLNPRFKEIYYAKMGRRYFYRTIGKFQLEILEPPYENWLPAPPLYLDNHQTIQEWFADREWEPFDFESFKQKFKNCPFFLDNEQRKEHLKQKKIRDYKIRKERIMKGGYRE